MDNDSNFQERGKRGGPYVGRRGEEGKGEGGEARPAQRRRRDYTHLAFLCQSSFSVVAADELESVHSKKKEGEICKRKGKKKRGEGKRPEPGAAARAPLGPPTSSGSVYDRVRQPKSVIKKRKGVLPKRRGGRKWKDRAWRICCNDLWFCLEPNVIRQQRKKGGKGRGEIQPVGNGPALPDCVSTYHAHATCRVPC